MRFIKRDNTVKVFTQPVYNLLSAGFSARLPKIIRLFFLAPAQGRIGGKQDAVFLRDFVAGFGFTLQENFPWIAADTRKVPFSILYQTLVEGNPYRLVAALHHVIQNDAGYFPAFAYAGPVANKKAFPRTVRQQLRMCLSGINHSLKLRYRQ